MEKAKSHVKEQVSMKVICQLSNIDIISFKPCAPLVRIYLAIIELNILDIFCILFFIIRKFEIVYQKHLNIS